MDSLRLVPSDVRPGGEPALFDGDRYAVSSAPSDGSDGPLRGSTPPVPSIAIRRDRLERLLDDHPERRVILVRGPAGAGKTVLVAQWVRSHAPPCAWLSVDAAHNDPQRLLWHLVEALNRLSPDAVDRVVALTPAGAGPDNAVLRDLIEQVSRDLGTPIILAVDDVHRLHDPAARQVLNQLVEHPPEGVRVVLIARSKPRLGLARARLRGDLVEVTPAALCFQRTEINALAGSWTGRSPAPAELEQVTLGWTAGLRLAHLDAAPDDGLFAGSAEPDGIASEYVSEELLDAEAGADESRGVGPFLEVSCWLPVLTEPLRAAVAEQGSSPRPTVSWGDLEALPIHPIASRPGTFRYPPILRRVVQQEYRRRDPEAAMAACRRAAEACRQAGELATAIELFLEVGGIDEAARVCADLAERGEPSLRALDELAHRRPEILPDSPRLLPWRIRAAVAAGHVDEGRDLLSPADRSRAADPPAEGRDMVIARAVLAERTGDASTLLAGADELLATPEERPGIPPADRQTQQTRQIRQAHGWRIRARVWSGDLVGGRSALQALERATALAGGADPDAAADVALARAWIAWLDGDVARTTGIVAAVRRDGGRPEHAAELDLLAGTGQRERNQLAKALVLVQEARAQGVASAGDVVAALAASELARCHRAAGAGMEALELVVATRAEHPHLPLAVDAHLRTTEVRVRLDQADVAGARVVLHDAPAGADTGLLAVRLALHEAPGEAAARLEQVEARTSRQTVDKLLLLAQLPDNDEAAAGAALVAAIAVGGPLGLVRTFLDESQAVSHRLQQLAFASPERTLGHLAALVSQELALGSALEPALPIGQLTSRELAVLRMLPLRMSNREMAAQMYVSVNTLKTHIRAIYRKLDVPHRSAAVSRARALQLV
jgi:LuxR family maltose regulon positive regulatory protein